MVQTDDYFALVQKCYVLLSICGPVDVWRSSSIGRGNAFILKKTATGNIVSANRL